MTSPDPAVGYRELGRVMARELQLLACRIEAGNCQTPATVRARMVLDRVRRPDFFADAESATRVIADEFDRLIRDADGTPVSTARARAALARYHQHAIAAEQGDP